VQLVHLALQRGDTQRALGQKQRIIRPELFPDRMLVLVMGEVGRKTCTTK
jgi:hypothetical protein